MKKDSSEFFGLPGRKTGLKAFIKGVGILALLLAGSWAARGQSPFFLTTTTDGNGLFTYEFSPGDANFVMAMYPNTGQVVLPSYGVLGVTSPAGWSASVQNDTVTWMPLSGPTVYLGSPSLSFSIQSSSTASALYEGPPGSGSYSGGVVLGVVHFLDPADQNGGGEGSPGFLGFSFTGPAVIPEPSPVVLILVGALVVGSLRKCRRRDDLRSGLLR